MHNILHSQGRRIVLSTAITGLVLQWLRLSRISKCSPVMASMSYGQEWSTDAVQCTMEVSTMYAQS